jgi:hypothetical protein
LCGHRHLGRLSGLLGLRFLLAVRKGLIDNGRRGTIDRSARDESDITHQHHRGIEWDAEEAVQP